MDEQLREQLLRYLRHKFSGQADILQHAEDIVQEAFLRVPASQAEALAPWAREYWEGDPDGGLLFVDWPRLASKK